MTQQQTTITSEPSGLVGESVLRVDSLQKLTGRAIYTRDIKSPGMLHARIKRCPYPHAKILKIDVSKAREIHGVKAVIVGNDFHPPSTVDTPALAYGEVLYANQAVAAVAALDPLTAEQAVESITVEYERLPAVFDAELAMSKNSPTSLHVGETEGPNIARHIKVVKGNTMEALARADFVIEKKYTTAMESQFQLEPLTFLAQPDQDGGFTLWATVSGSRRTQAALVHYLRFDPSRVRVRVPFIGGWFGRKEEYHLAAICAMLTIKSGRPVKLELSREETFTATGVRHSSTIYIKDGVNKSGKITAREIKAVYNGGAYGSIGNLVLKDSPLAAIGVYDIPNIKIDSYRVYTNIVPAVMKRSPMATQMVWAIECQMDHLASELRIDPTTFRLMNILREGSENAIGEKMEGISHDKCLQAVARTIGWKTKPSPEGPWRRGKGISLAAGTAIGGPHQAMVRVTQTGSVEVWADIVENGQGSFTGLTQIVADAFGIPAEDVVLMPLIYGSDSVTSGISVGASGSRQLVNIGNALLMACNEAKLRIAEQAAKKLSASPHEIDVKGKRAFVRFDPARFIEIPQLFTKTPMVGLKITSSFLDGKELVGYGTVHRREGKLDPDTGRCVDGRISPYYISVAQAVDLSVNIETGRIKVHKVAAAMDVGKAINPDLVRGQIVGSVMMGLSAALSEELIESEGAIANANLADYKILNAIDVPPVEPIILETPYEGGPFGAKGVGEASILPTTSAVRNAVFDATGITIDSLPITPEKILEAIHTSE